VAASHRVTGLWVYQSPGLVDAPPNPTAVATLAARHGLTWLSAEAFAGTRVLDEDWLHKMRQATTRAGLRLGVHGYIGRPQPRPQAEAEAVSDAISRAQADFVIVDAEDEYEKAPSGTSKRFVAAYRQLRPRFRSYFSSFGRPSLHGGLDWKAWASAGFAGMPQAYQNLNPASLRPSSCVDDWAQFFVRSDLRPTLGCFSEGAHGHLPTAQLVESVRDVPSLSFNVYRHGTVTDAELTALSTIT
jgi:hypothetical protein